MPCACGFLGMVFFFWTLDFLRRRASFGHGILFFLGMGLFLGACGWLLGVGFLGLGLFLCMGLFYRMGLLLGTGLISGHVSIFGHWIVSGEQDRSRSCGCFGRVCLLGSRG